MGGQGRLIGGLALCLVGVLGVCVACGLPMWRETSFVGANVVTAQLVWDGLWLHCIVQSTGQTQCKRHTTLLTLTPDIQAGRALTLISIIAGFLGFIITLLGGGAINCSGDPPNPLETRSSSATKKKVCLLGGALCILAGILCLISVSWSAGATISLYNDPLVTPALKREVGSSVYIGWVSSALLLLSGALICFVCGAEERYEPSYHYTPYNSNTLSRRSDSTTSNMYNYPVQTRMMEQQAQVQRYNSQTLNQRM